VEEVFRNSILGFPLNAFLVWTPSILPNPDIRTNNVNLVGLVFLPLAMMMIVLGSVCIHSAHTDPIKLMYN
jgi:hypothetical protein